MAMKGKFVASLDVHGGQLGFLIAKTRGPMGLYRSPGSLGLMVDQIGKFGSNQLGSFIRIDFQKSGKKYV